MIAAISTIFTRRLARGRGRRHVARGVDEYVKSVTAKNSVITYIDVAKLRIRVYRARSKCHRYGNGSKSKSIGGEDSSNYPDATFDGLLDPVNGTVAQRVFFTKRER